MFVCLHLLGWSTGWLTVYEVSLVLGQTHLAQAKGPRYPPHPSTSPASPSTYGRAAAHTSLRWCTTNPWIPFTAWQSIGLHLIHRKQCLATLREYPARGATPHPGASSPKHTTPHPPTLTPRITHPHPSSKRLEKWEMFSLQPSHYQCTHPSEAVFPAVSSSSLYFCDLLFT